MTQLTVNCIIIERWCIIKRLFNLLLLSRCRDERGDIVGSLLVRPDEVSSLLANWVGAADRGERKSSQLSVPPIAARMSRKQVRQFALRGC
jgi:hypothetical protein